MNVEKVREFGGKTKTGLTVILQREMERNILTYPGTIFDLTIDDLDFDYLTIRDIFIFRLSICSVVSAACRRTVSPVESRRAHDFARYQRRSRRPLGRRLEDVLRYVDVFLPNAREKHG